MKRAGIILALLAMITGLIFFAERQLQKEIDVSQTINPRRDTITKKKIVSGNIYPYREIEVKSVLSGVLEVYYVKIGDQVRTGDKIAKIKTLPEPSEIEQAKMNLRLAEIAFEKDRTEYERDKVLYEKNVISASEFDASEKVYKTSKEHCEYNKNQLHLLTEGFIPSTRVSNVVLATANGAIIDLPLKEGVAVAGRSAYRDGTNIALIARLDSFFFKGKVVETDALVFREGSKLTVAPTSMAEFKIEARICKIAPKGYLDQGVMKYDIEAIFTRPDRVNIFSGLNATAEFIQDERHNVLTLPESCLIFDDDSTYVDILEKGSFKKKPILTGLSNGITVEIISGLSEEDRVKKR
ncbi:MAG: efflux RND transporter periplasmic adaptor subunit [Tannerellaceae bacterium]|jgi:HlyD family secretion protein|nr:efflux RND transporter periplasmic adaptor subunit [Tannerellaceae bacterium]